ncbi:MAG: preprotein translocase subunit TatB [Rhodospirillaceae bacterium]|mgnify:CR=1 FL=1|nr:preprotein translocase subunit TatB [Rhodospirillaceae bacterium]HAA93373.1 sulfurtransferase TusA family protein [Rhodospirillaceae bacterium]
MSDEPVLIDASGLRCPMPVLKAQKALRTLDSGTQVTLIATDPVSYIDVRHFCETSGHTLLSAEEDTGTFTYLIEKGSDS